MGLGRTGWWLVYDDRKRLKAAGGAKSERSKRRTVGENLVPSTQSVLWNSHVPVFLVRGRGHVFWRHGHALLMHTGVQFEWLAVGACGVCVVL